MSKPLKNTAALRRESYIPVPERGLDAMGQQIRDLEATTEIYRVALVELVAACKRADDKFRATIDGEWALYEDDYTAIRQAMWRASEAVGDGDYASRRSPSVSTE